MPLNIENLDGVSLIKYADDSTILVTVRNVFIYQL